MELKKFHSAINNDFRIQMIIKNVSDTTIEFITYGTVKFKFDLKLVQMQRY